MRIEVKIRSHAPSAPAWLDRDAEEAVITFDTPQWAVTPGQFAVVYDGDVVLGGGMMVSAVARGPVPGAGGKGEGAER